MIFDGRGGVIDRRSYRFSDPRSDQKASEGMLDAAVTVALFFESAPMGETP
jgi:hypothetical protein